MTSEESSSRQTSRLRLLGLAAYLTGVLWWALFPLVSVTTGEMKPRSLFIDEKAVLTRPMSEEAATAWRVHRQEVTSSLELCELVKETEGVVDCRRFGDTGVRRLTQVVLKGVDKPLSKESVLLVLPIVQESRPILEWTLSLIRFLVQFRWLAKTVVVLLTPLDCDHDICFRRASHDPGHHIVKASRTLEEWIKSYRHKNDLHSAVGVIRQAYVIDLTEVVDELGSGLSSVSATLFVMGCDGQLPNMDLVAFPVHLFPDIRVEDAHPHAKHEPGSLSEYLNRGQSLLAWTLLSSQGASGMHAQLLRENIDAITLKFHAANETAAMKAKDIGIVVANLVKVSCFLHGEDELLIVHNLITFMRRRASPLVLLLHYIPFEFFRGMKYSFISTVTIASRGYRSLPGRFLCKCSPWRWSITSTHFQSSRCGKFTYYLHSCPQI